MPSITQDITLGHQPQKSASAEKISLPAGEEVTIVREFEHHYLVKTGEGKVFNVKKEFVDATS